MTEDDLILLFAFIICWSTFAALTLKSKNKKRTLLISFGIQIAYSIYFFYGLKFESQYGGGLVWWFFFLIAIGIHCFINATIIIIDLIRTGLKPKTVDGQIKRDS